MPRTVQQISVPIFYSLNLILRLFNPCLICELLQDNGPPSDINYPPPNTPPPELTYPKPTTKKPQVFSYSPVEKHKPTSAPYKPEPTSAPYRPGSNRPLAPYKPGFNHPPAPYRPVTSIAPYKPKPEPNYPTRDPTPPKNDYYPIHEEFIPVTSFYLYLPDQVKTHFFNYTFPPPSQGPLFLISSLLTTINKSIIFTIIHLSMLLSQ